MRKEVSGLNISIERTVKFKSKTEASLTILGTVQRSYFRAIHTNLKGIRNILQRQ